MFRFFARCSVSIFELAAWVLVLGLVLAVTSGCTVFGAQTDRAALYAGRAVQDYCLNIQAPEIRKAFRDKVNAAASPHTVEINCVYPILPAPPAH